MFASFRNKPLARAVPSATKNRVMAQEEKVAANGIAIKQLHATSFGSLLGRKNMALDHLKIPRRNRSHRKDIRQSSAGSLEFASANSFGCLRLWRLHTCLPSQKGEKGERKKGSLSKLREVPFASELGSSVPLGRMQSRPPVSDHAAPLATETRVESPARSSSG